MFKAAPCSSAAAAAAVSSLATATGQDKSDTAGVGGGETSSTASASAGPVLDVAMTEEVMDPCAVGRGLDADLVRVVCALVVLVGFEGGERHLPCKQQ